MNDLLTFPGDVLEKGCGTRGEDNSGEPYDNFTALYFDGAGNIRFSQDAQQKGLNKVLFGAGGQVIRPPAV